MPICELSGWHVIRAKYSGDGKEFVENAALFRYYSGLAEQTETRYLNRWRAQQARLAALQSWLDRAEFARRDLEAAHRDTQAHSDEISTLRKARDSAWRQLQESAQKHQEADLQRQKLLAFEEFLRSGNARFPLDFCSRNRKPLSLPSQLLALPQ